MGSSELTFIFMSTNYKSPQTSNGTDGAIAPLSRFLNPDIITFERSSSLNLSFLLKISEINVFLNGSSSLFRKYHWFRISWWESQSNTSLCPYLKKNKSSFFLEKKFAFPSEPFRSVASGEWRRRASCPFVSALYK